MSSHETLDQYLTSRFKQSEPYNKGQTKWWLSSYDNFGAEYGLTLMKHGLNDMYRLESFEDAGYSPPRLIAILYPDSVLILANAMRPTNPECKYDS